MNERESRTSDNTGMPLRPDSYRRKWSDACDPNEPVYSWHPANPPAEKLWRILESIRDLVEGLSGLPTPTPAQTRRRIKLLATPLYSLASHIRALCNEVATSPELGNLVTTDERRMAAELVRDIERILPIAKNGALRVVRDRLSSHIDINILPEEARRVLSDASPATFRTWVHQAVAVVYHLLAFRAYGWTTRDTTPNQLQLMTSEPFLVTFRINAKNRPVEILDITLVQTPKHEVATECAELIRRIDALVGANTG